MLPFRVVWVIGVGVGVGSWRRDALLYDVELILLALLRSVRHRAEHPRETLDILLRGEWRPRVSHEV